MDDQSAYFLSGILTRHFALGRVVRFREVSRGRQAACHELLTAQQRAYVVYVFPPVFDRAGLVPVGPLLEFLDANRFSVLPMVKAREETYVVDGPQGGSLMVGLPPEGQLRLPDEWSDHDLSQLGLRLAWMHRLLKEYTIGQPLPASAPLRQRFEGLLDHPAPEVRSRVGHLPAAALQHLAGRLPQDLPLAPCHGDIHPASVLVDADHQLRSIVDWGLFHAGHPLEDLVAAAVHWCLRPDAALNREAAGHLIEAYASLHRIEPAAWRAGVDCFLAQHVLDTAQGRRTMPRALPALLEDPQPLVAGLEASSQ